MVMRMNRPLPVVACLSLLAPSVVRAQVESLVTTNQAIVVNGAPLRYTAQVGRIPIQDAESGEPHGYRGFIA